MYGALAEHKVSADLASLPHVMPKHSPNKAGNRQAEYDLEDVDGQQATRLVSRVQHKLQERKMHTVFHPDVCLAAVREAMLELHKKLLPNEKSQHITVNPAQRLALEEEVVAMACDILTGNMLRMRGVSTIEPTEEIPEQLPVDTNGNILLAIEVIHLAIVSEIAAEFPNAEQDIIENVVLAELPKHIRQNGMDCDYLLDWEAHRDEVKEKAMRVLEQKKTGVVLPAKTVMFEAPELQDIPEHRHEVGLVIRKLRAFISVQVRNDAQLWENETEKRMYTKQLSLCNINVSLAPKLEEDMLVFFVCWQHERAKSHAKEIQAMVPFEQINEFLASLMPEERLWLHASAYYDRWEAQRDECEHMCTSDNQSHQLLAAQTKMHALEDGYEAYMKRQKEREIFAQLRGQPPANGARIGL